MSKIGMGRAVPLVAIAVVAAGTVAALSFWPSEPVGGADPTDKELVALGRRVYAENCASCHGGNLEGEPNWRQRKPSGALPAPPHNADGHTWHHPDEQLFAITKEGIAAFAPDGYKTDMPAFGDVLTDEEIWASLAYIKSRWPKEIQEAQAARNQR